jgi:hypothetical protein
MPSLLPDGSVSIHFTLTARNEWISWDATWRLQG